VTLIKTSVVTALMVAMFSSNAKAEWVQVGENNRLVAYADNAVRRSGDTATFWVLFDYKTVQVSPSSGRRYLSEKAQREIDCRSERDRAIFFTWHSDQMGNGTVVYTGNKPTSWEPTSSPGSFANSFWKFACSKK
jgi:hypothetical protein